MLTFLLLPLLLIVLYLYWKAKQKAAIRRAMEVREAMVAANRGHYEYNGPFEVGDLVCNGHFPKDSAEIICFNDGAASWLKAKAIFHRGYWPNDRALVVASTEDALGIVTKAVADGLKVTTNHIPPVIAENEARPNHFS